MTVTMSRRDGSGYDPVATLARVERLIGLLRTRRVRAGWSVDDADCERVLRYYRKLPDGTTADREFAEFAFTIKFFTRYGQSLDWVLMGRPDGMICKLANHAEGTPYRENPTYQR